MTGVKRFNRQDYFFLFYLIVVVSAFSVHLLSFTLFDGFTTFSNDAGNYVLLARKWSPFFLPSDAEVYTWPLQVLPPGLSWTLAITGASESLWLSHLFVSFCMLASLILIGWMAYHSLGWLIGGTLIMALCLLPGVIISSLGILSENLYLFLSLTALLLYSFINNSNNAGWGWYLLLFLVLSFTILTRTIGISLIAAIFLVTLFSTELARKQKHRYLTVVFSSVLVWWLWGVLNSQPGDLTYDYYLEPYINSEVNIFNVLTVLLQTFSANLMQIMSSWSHYLSLTHTSFWFFLYSYGLLSFCVIGLGLRLAQRKLDAVYVLIYLLIILIWPHPNEMTRFLHPIAFLLILQPFLHFTSSPKTSDRLMVKSALVIAIMILIGNSTIIQMRMQEQRALALNSSPDLSHSYEYYDFTSRELGLTRALIFANVTKYITSSAQHIPVHSVVAAVKHINHAILTDRRTVNLVAAVSGLQQLCNLKIKDVDFIFLSALTTGFNKEGLSLLKKFKNISSATLTVKGRDGEDVAYNLVIDKAKLNLELEKAEYNCQSYQHQP